MGIRFVMNTVVGRDITVEQIKTEQDAVYFGTGAWSQPVLGLEGENLTEFGLNFLEEVNTYLEKAMGEHVLVCGGGNVAMDVALTACRLGAKSVKLVCLEQREEMPASEEEIRMALEEGVEIINGWGLGKVLEEQGKVKGLLAKRCVSVRDEKGRFAPVYNILHKGELVTEIQVPKAVGETNYDKRRVCNAIDFAIVSLASDITVKDGVIESCRLVLGGVTPVPYELPEVEAYLVGKAITPEIATEGGEIAMKNAFAMSKNEYKIFMCKDVIYNRIMGVGK